MNTLIVIAAIRLLVPAEGETIALLPDCQKAVLTNETHAARETALKSLKKERGWGESLPVAFSWQATAGEHEPWELAISMNADLADARTECFEAKTNAEGVVRYVLPYANLELGARYCWKVRGTVERVEKVEGAEKTVRKEIESAQASFSTEDMAPRWMKVWGGHIWNFRDLGGRVGLGGKRVRQGMAYRSVGLNDNSVNGKRKGHNRLMVDDVDYMTNVLGIKTDLDLRSKRETADMAGSPLGPRVKWIQNSSDGYGSIFLSYGKRSTAVNFRVFCDERNYPIIFHCIAGADRTGTLGYVLNGLLGVSKRELETDWEMTFYPGCGHHTGHDLNKPSYLRQFDEGFSKYGQEGDPLARRIELYLLDCGITPEEIATFRRIMLE